MDNLRKQVDMDKGTCSVDGCDRAASAQGWCLSHYSRWVIHGDPGPAEFKQRRTGCSIPGCEGKHSGLGYCYNHRRRFKLYGDPLAPKRCGAPAGDDHPNARGDNVEYAAVHRRLRVRRGPARNFDCLMCPNQAKHWAYTHTAAVEMNNDGRPYSTDLDDYVPLCVPCHARVDNGSLLPELLTLL